MTTRTKRKLTVAAVLLIAIAGFMVSAVKAASIFIDDRTPDLPDACSTLEVDEGNKLAFHAYATGAQIYRWNGTSWIFVAPDAKLFANEQFKGKIGTHYVGPTWESNSGSKIVAAKIDECTPDTTAIPWLKLQKVVTDGPGIFERVTFIQRVNTTGGLKPTLTGTTMGEERAVPYAAEYYFYRAQ